MEASDFKPRVRSGEKTSESFTPFKMELRNWVGGVYDNVPSVMELPGLEDGHCRGRRQERMNEPRCNK